MISLMLFIVISLFVGILLKLILKRTFVPYTVGLFVVGLLVGVCARYELFHMPHTVDAVLVSIADMNPEFILYLFLPILVFEASLNMNIHVFRKTFINANILAIPGVVIALLLTAVMLMGISLLFPNYAQWTWTIALMFGALISATDPVAVVALLKELRTNKRFSTLVDAESMLNDGTGIVFFMLFFGAFTTVGLHYGPVNNFLITVVGAVAVGLFIGGLSLWLAVRARTEPILQSCLMIIASYILFYLSNSLLEVSGVISLVTFGLVIAYGGPTRLQPKVNEFIRDFWELVAYIANTLIFIIVGVMIALKCDFMWSDIGILLLVYMGLNIIRTVMVFLFFPLMRKVGYGITLNEAIVLSWGGLRGAVGLTLALLVFYTPAIPEIARNQMLFLTGGVVTLTLLLNATTMGWLLKFLKLTRVSSAKQLLEYNAKVVYQERTFRFFEELKKERYLEGVNWKKLETYLPTLEDCPITETVSSSSLTATARRRILERNLTFCQYLYQEGIISPYALRKLTTIIEEQDDYDGKCPFNHMQNNFANTSAIVKPWQQKLMIWSYHITSFFRKRVVNRYDTLRGFIIMEREAIKVADELADSLKAQTNGKEIIEIIVREIESNIRMAEAQFDLLEKSFPIGYRMAVNSKAKRMLLRKERGLVKELVQSGMLDDEAEAAMLEKIESMS